MSPYGMLQYFVVVIHTSHPQAPNLLHDGPWTLILQAALCRSCLVAFAPLHFLPCSPTGQAHGDSQSVGAQNAVASIATAYGLKGAWYAATARDVMANAARITREFMNKEYPLSWWRSRLVEGLSRGGTVTVQQADSMVKQALQTT